MRFAFFGSSLVSAYWNGAATYYRGIIRALHALGHEITFYEPDAYERQAHRDIPDPAWARVVVYRPVDARAVRDVVHAARETDVVVKCSGVGVFDDVLESAVVELAGPERRILWDVDAPATLQRMEADPSDPLRELVPAYDLVLTYGGGDPVVRRYEALGARRCVPIYNGLDPDVHHPEPPRPEFAADLSLVANRLPDRERRIDAFFFDAARLAPEQTFLLGGNGWETSGPPTPSNVRLLGHVPTTDHNAVNSSARAVLNVSRDSMAANGYSPATRVFEAAGAAACLITDVWEGIETFFVPDEEILLADDGAQVASILRELDPGRAASIGAAARERAVAEHTYTARAAEVQAVLEAPVTAPSAATDRTGH